MIRVSPARRNMSGLNKDENAEQNLVLVPNLFFILSLRVESGGMLLPVVSTQKC